MRRTIKSPIQGEKNVSTLDGETSGEKWQLRIIPCNKHLLISNLSVCQIQSGFIEFICYRLKSFFLENP